VKLGSADGKMTVGSKANKMRRGHVGGTGTLERGAWRCLQGLSKGGQRVGSHGGAGWQL